MLAVRAFSHIVSNEPAEAALWAERAARAPAASADRVDRRNLSRNERGQAACFGVGDLGAQATAGDRPNDFLQAFPFRGAEARDRITRTLRTVLL